MVCPTIRKGLATPLCQHNRLKPNAYTYKHRRSQARAYPGNCPGITHLCPSISKLSGFLGITKPRTKQAHILNIQALLYFTYNNFMVPML